MGGSTLVRRSGVPVPPARGTAPRPPPHLQPPHYDPSHLPPHPYERCIFYTVLLAVVALDRPTLKARVIDSPEVLSVLDALPHLRPFLSALHGCQYAEFFQVGPWEGAGAFLACLLLPAAQSIRPTEALPGSRCPCPCRCRSATCLQAFAGLTEAVRADPYLHPHFRYYMREVRAEAYAQVGGCR